MTSYDAAQEIEMIKLQEKKVSLVKNMIMNFQKYFKEFINYFEKNKKKFWNLVDRFRSPHLLKKQNNNWVLKNKIT